MAGAEILDEMSMLSPCSRHIYIYNYIYIVKFVYKSYFLGMVLGLRGVYFRGGQVIHQSPLADDSTDIVIPPAGATWLEVQRTG